MNDRASTAVSTRKRHALDLFARLPRQYERVGAILSLGQDPRWRRAMVAAVGARPGERVLDVATGTGLVARALARRYRCTVVGLDQSAEMLAVARAQLARDPTVERLITFVSGEAERLPFGDAEFDHLTFTYLLRYVDDPAATLRELARVVRPGGRIASLEFAVPPSAPVRGLWTIYTRYGLPTLGRLVSREWGETGRFLARSIPEFYAHHPLEQLVELWSEAGVGSVQVQRMSLGGGVVMWGSRDDGRAEAA
jgi:demethylmenaquinone methyltransferase / 2-methoxy-6-polyprenyl-1,4-benzoquinol methylase